ncbi:hypothetical protein [Microbispora sp. GKU 823]|uniref:hypothetical protein n=1 Tax=Microbispora sp. GKU 823 TaxID=1652100 RepID=UPI0021179130|nr:hypothetical protein [Microbispora sp. GKU 823]
MHLTTQRRAAWALAALAVGAFTYVTAEVLPIGLLTVMAADLDRSRPRRACWSRGTPRSWCWRRCRSPG